MRKLLTLLIAAFVVSLSAPGLASAVTIQLTTTPDISGASQDASGNYYVTEGGSFDVTLDASNYDSSQETATNVEATLSLPSGLSTSDSLTKAVAGSLAYGESADTSWTVTGDIAGNYLGQIELTSQGTNTAQNEDTTGVLVKSPATIIGGISCSATDSKVIKSGFDVTVTVQNLGDLEATGISINLTSDPPDISITNPKTISSIGGGESGQKTYSLSTTQETTYTFTATVTSGNAGSDTVQCATETVSSLPDGYVCTSSSQCTSGCCSSSLCKPHSYCDSGDGTGNGNGGPGGGGPPSENNATRKPQLVPGVGLQNNTKLQAAMQKVLGLANMSEQARENLMRLSESISSQIQMTRNFRSANRTSTMETRLAYSGTQRAVNFMFYDAVPKDFAQHSDNITVTALGATMEVVDADPEYIFAYPQFDPGQEIIITYSVGATMSEDVIDSFSAEAYAQALEEAPITTCTSGETRCSGNDLQACQDSVWVTQETCEYGCSGGVCNTVPPAGPEDYTFIIIIAVVAVLIIAFVAFLVRKKSGGSGPVRADHTIRPLTPSQRPYTPGTYRTPHSAYDRLRSPDYNPDRD